MTRREQQPYWWRVSPRSRSTRGPHVQLPPYPRRGPPPALVDRAWRRPTTTRPRAPAQGAPGPRGPRRPRDRRRRHRVPHDRHPRAERPRGRPGLGHLLLRRHDGDGPDRHRQPRGRRARRDPRRRAARVHRRRGPLLLRQPGHLAQGHLPRGERGPGRGGPRWRLDDHPAVREELLPHPGPDDRAQGARDPHLGEDRRRAEQGRDPGQLPQHHLLRPRGRRDPDRLAGLLRQGRRGPLGLRGRPAGQRHPRSLALRPLARAGADHPGEGEVGLRPRRHGREGLDDARRAREAEVPEGQGAQTLPVALERHRFHHRGGAHRAAQQARALRRRHRPGRVQDRHDDRQEGAARRP